MAKKKVTGAPRKKKKRVTSPTPRAANRRAGEAEGFLVTYKQISSLTGKSLNTIYANKSRGNFDPNVFESILYYVARHGKFNVKRKIMEYALERETDNPADY